VASFGNWLTECELPLVELKMLGRVVVEARVMKSLKKGSQRRLVQSHF